MKNQKSTPSGPPPIYRRDPQGAEHSPGMSKSRAREIASVLGGEVIGDNIACPGPSHSRRDRSLSIKLDLSAPDGFRVHSFAGDDWRICRDYVKAALGLQTDRTYVPPVRQQAASASSSTQYAASVWRASRAPSGTLAAKYLAGRGIGLKGDMLHVLRYHPSCPFSKGQKFPAMIALFRDIRTDEPCGVHRTALTQDGRKIDRKMLGQCRDAAIKLSPDHHVTLGLGIAEGIETGLSVHQAGWKPIWSLGSAGGIARFQVVNGIESLTIFADHDLPGIEAAMTCAERWRDAGREVRVIYPQSLHSDFNDSVRHA